MLGIVHGHRHTVPAGSTAPLPQWSPNQAGGLAGRLTAPVRLGQWNETVPGPVVTMLCERYGLDPVQVSGW